MSNYIEGSNDVNHQEFVIRNHTGQKEVDPNLKMKKQKSNNPVQIKYNPNKITI